MEYNKIIAVTGLPGLYELLSSKSDGAVVRSLDDKSTKFVSSRIHNFSHLESIEIFTVKDNVNLVEVLNAMDGSGEKLPDEKDPAGLKKYFSKVYPDMDFERVYPSDLKKMVKWFSVLKSNKVEIKLTEPQPEEEEPITETPAPVKKEKGEKPASKKETAPETKETKPVKEKAAAEKPSGKEEKPKSKAKVEEEPKPRKAAPKKAVSKDKETKPAERSKKAAPAKKKSK